MSYPIALSLPGGPEWFFIILLVLLLFGAKKLPELARGLGQSMGEFKRAREDFEREIHKRLQKIPLRRKLLKRSPRSPPEPAVNPQCRRREDQSRSCFFISPSSSRGGDCCRIV